MCVSWLIIKQFEDMHGATIKKMVVSLSFYLAEPQDCVLKRRCHLLAITEMNR